jgi:hypothetical protein
MTANSILNKYLSDYDTKKKSNHRMIKLNFLNHILIYIFLLLISYKELYNKNVGFSQS